MLEYKVKLDIFEGPLDLLLYLIKKDEVDIYEISIEKVTTQYLEFLEAFQALHIELAGEFIVMAANLLYIKSRTLLPKNEQMAEVDSEEDDPRWELIRQLIEYKKFKEAASQLRDKEALQEMLFPRAPSLPAPEAPDANFSLKDVGIFDLINAFQKILKSLDSKKEDLREIFAEKFTVADKIDYLLQLTSAGVPVLFTECFVNATSRTEIAVTFLAMLELIRLKQIRVKQSEAFGEIWIESATSPLPAETTTANPSITK